MVADTSESHSYSHAGFFALRTPLLPFDEFLHLGRDLTAPEFRSSDDGQLDAALRSDRALIRGRLLGLVERPVFREALYVASPDLFDGLAAWKDAPNSERGQRVERALMRYVTRSAYRATPFGLFAGCSVATLEQAEAKTVLRLGPLESYRRHTRVDLGYLAALSDSLARDPAIRGACRHRVNSSLYVGAGRYHFVESYMQDSRMRVNRLSAVEATPYLEDTLQRSRSGATYEELISGLVQGDVTREDAEAYLTELLDNQVLVPDLGITVTGNEPLDCIIRDLGNNAAGRDTAQQLHEVREELAALDAEGLGASPDLYQSIGRRLRALFPAAGLRDLFQVDMVKPIQDARLASAVVRDIVAGAELLRRITPHYDELGDFVKAFVERYEQQEVPLAEALDEEMGIGLPGYDGMLKEPQRRLELNQQRQSVMVELLTRTLANQQQELVLTESDLRHLEAEASPLPDALAVVAAIAAVSEEALERGEYRILWLGSYGPSGANHLGRFCHADPALHANVDRYLRMEEALQPTAVFVEVVHLPEGRVGNVLCRPRLRAYEIPYLGKSGADESHQLPITDLMISVIEDRVVLRSRRLGREVIPRMTTMHNFRYPVHLPVYRFLGLLQGHRTESTLGWSWGLMADLPFLPRVRFERLIVSRARWNVSAEEIASLNASLNAGRFRKVQKWCEDRAIPRFALLVQGDNHLPIDFHSVLSVDVFLDLARRAGTATLLELYPAPGTLVANGAEGSFTHEVVLPLIRSGGKGRDPGRLVAAVIPRTARIRQPGSDWLHVKLYTGPNLIDRLIRKVIAPLVKQTRTAGAVEKWFFVRYADPHAHLRVRFHGEPSRLRADVLPLLDCAIAPLIEKGFVWKMQYDTYVRELERYGGEQGMAVAESIFHADSEAVLELLDQVDTGSAMARQLVAVRSIHSLLEDFEVGLGERLRILTDRTTDASPGMRKRWGAEYRQYRGLIEAALGGESVDNVSRILGDRSVRVTALAAKLRQQQLSGLLVRPITELFFSYSHMHLNRILTSIDNRAVEPVIYDFLRRWYTGAVAQHRK